MSKIKIAELFYSIQGEGRYMGVPSVFLRTFGCNFKCAGFGMPRGELSAEIEPIAQRIKGGILNAVAKLTGKPVEIEIPIDKAQSKYKFTEQDLATLVTGIKYMYMSETQSSTSNAFSDAFISIASFVDTMPSNQAFKRVSYLINVDINDNTYQYFLMNYYTNNAVTDTVGEMQQGNNATISSVNTFEGKSGKIEFPQDAANLIRTGFPTNYMEIQKSIKDITGVSITFTSADDSNKQRTDFL